MAKSKKDADYHALPLSTEITVCAVKDGNVVIKNMTFGEALQLKKTPGWTYTNYQKGFCAMQPTKIEKDGDTRQD